MAEPNKNDGATGDSSEPKQGDRQFIDVQNGDIDDNTINANSNRGSSKSGGEKKVNMQEGETKDIPLTGGRANKSDGQQKKVDAGTMQPGDEKTIVIPGSGMPQSGSDPVQRIGAPMRGGINTGAREGLKPSHLDEGKPSQPNEEEQSPEEEKDSKGEGDERKKDEEDEGDKKDADEKKDGKGEGDKGEKKDEGKKEGAEDEKGEGEKAGKPEESSKADGKKDEASADKKPESVGGGLKPSQTNKGQPSPTTEGSKDNGTSPKQEPAPSNGGTPTAGGAGDGTETEAPQGPISPYDEQIEQMKEADRNAGRGTLRDYDSYKQGLKEEDSAKADAGDQEARGRMDKHREAMRAYQPGQQKPAGGGNSPAQQPNKIGGIGKPNAGDTGDGKTADQTGGPQSGPSAARGKAQASSSSQQAQRLAKDEVKKAAKKVVRSAVKEMLVAISPYAIALTLLLIVIAIAFTAVFAEISVYACDTGGSGPVLSTVRTGIKAAEKLGSDKVSRLRSIYSPAVCNAVVPLGQEIHKHVDFGFTVTSDFILDLF